SAPSTPGGVVVPGSPQDVFAKLQPEQQSLVRQRYKDAKNLYMQGKYQLAQDEIIKIQELVPDYEDIKEIARLSKEAIFIQDQQRRQEEIERAKLEAEEKILAQTKECQKKISPSITAAEMEDCLSSVLQFNPDHPRILELRAQVETLTAQRQARDAERAQYQSQVARLRNLYEQAQKVHKIGKPLDAITAYEKVIDTRLPDPQGLKSQAQRSIASIRKNMNSKTANLQAEADKYYQSQNLKGAILSLRKARALDPMNPELPEKIERYTIELRKQMMAIYQEGILEESFGNVEGGDSKAGAKEKWRKILEMDVPDGEYYKKAYIKLKKYGAL
ncbi:MAG: FHA domain-containing protein, partial [Bdellovibrio sp.]